MPMQNMTELAQIYGAWNPEAYIQGADNVQRAARLNDTEYRQANENADATSLANQFNRDTYGERIKTPGLTNLQTESNIAGKAIENKAKAMDLERQVTAHVNQMDADKRKAFMQIDADQIAQYAQKAQIMAQSLDPREAQEGQRRLQQTAAVRAVKEKHKNDLELLRIKEAGDDRRTGMTTAASRYSADKSIERANAAAAKAVIPKPPTTAAGAWVQALAAELAAGRITRDQYLESVAATVNADLEARAGKNSQGVTTKVTPEGGVELANKSPVPAVRPPNASNAANQGTVENIGAKVTSGGVKYKVVTP